MSFGMKARARYAFISGNSSNINVNKTQYNGILTLRLVVYNNNNVCVGRSFLVIKCSLLFLGTLEEKDFFFEIFSDISHFSGFSVSGLYYSFVNIV